MGLKKVEDGWLADFRVKGKRYRKVFGLRADARDFETTMKYGFSKNPDEQSGISVAEAIREYATIETEKKKTKTHDKQFLSDFYDYLTLDQNIEFLSEVKLIHLNKYQTMLYDETQRKRLLQLSINAARSELKQTPDNKALSKRLRSMERCLVKAKGYKNSSINRRFGTLIDFFKHCKKWGLIDANPMAEFDYLSGDSESFKPWPSDKHIQQAIRLSDPFARKPLFLIAEAALRPVGVTRMTRDHVDMVNHRFCVVSYKGDGGKRKIHWIPMTEKLFQFFTIVMDDVESRPSDMPHREYLFLSETGLPLRTCMLSLQIAKATKIMGLYGFTLYGWRHTLATLTSNPNEEAQYSGNIETARRLLGHASIQQTQIYNQTPEAQVKSDFQKVSEFRNLTWKREVESELSH